MTTPSEARRTGNFRRLVAWQVSMDLVEEIYRVTSAFPDSERYGLIAQMRRSAVSIPSNIAEGNERRGNADKLRFLATARGSLSENTTQLEIAIRLGYVEEAAAERAFALMDSTSRLLTALRKSLTA